MVYTEDKIKESFDLIIDRIENGESLRSILRDSHTPSSATFYKWIDSSKERLKRYARATSLRADLIFEEMLEIADTPLLGIETTTKGGNIETKEGDMLGHRRLQIDARKWILGKMKPEKYGEKIDVTSGNEKINGTTIIVQDKKAKDELDKLIDEND